MTQDKKDLETLLREVEASILSSAEMSGYRANPHLKPCWQLRGCEKKRCSAYGRQETRCWHMVDTLCCKVPRPLSFRQKWLRHCRDCVVFKNATPTPKYRLIEFYNNLLFLQQHLSPHGAELTADMKRRFNRESARRGLSPREREVLLLLLERFTVPEIGAHLHVSENTVKTHLKSLYRKLEVHSKRELKALFGRGKAR